MGYQLLFYLICLVLPEFVTSQSRPTYLNLHTRYPNKDESDVCGRIRDAIPRNSGRFRKILIRNTNDLASYVNDDCRRMTSRTKSKLDILASLVRSNWKGGVKVKVLLAWTDQNIPSDKTSLHYEGRSLRLQLSDGDRSKLRILAGLALEAGFDWVHYVNVNYIRASVIPDVCQTSVDMVFLLDESGSVGRSNFGKVKQFVQKVIDFFNVGKTGTHIAVETYSTQTIRHFYLNSYFTKSELRNAVSKIVFRGGYTYTGEALDTVRNYVFNKKYGMRTDPGIPKVLVLLTDGRSNGKGVLGPANALRNQGVNIFSIGVGNGVSKTELNLIASDPDKDYVFELTSFNDLSSWVDRLSSVSCSEGSLIKSCEKSVTTVTSGSFKYFRTKFSFVTGNRVSVEIRDKKGISHLYASSTSKNPGPLDPNSEKNENDRSPRAVSVELNKVTKTVYVAVQGQQDINEFSLSFWDNLFSKSTFNMDVKEGLSKGQEIPLQLLSHQYSLEYTITDGNNKGYFRIEKYLPKIVTVKQLDRETTSEYNLVVVAQNNNNKCHKSRTLVVVNVVDVNDNAPQFTENPYRATIKENAQIGTIVKTVKATDNDVGKNAQITYSITSGNSGNLFRINKLGEVILQGDLDYENKHYYSIDLNAEDGGNPRMSGFSKLEISVSDVNESPSIRCKGSCSLKVSEDAPSGTVVGAVIGTDPDITTRCSVKYDINPSGARNTFEIRSNGEIRTNAKLDRELTPQYVFFARAQDCGSPPLSASVKVTVTVSDVNDNTPTFNGVYNVGILENEAVGSKVVQVKADDADAGNNGEVTYSLSGPDSSTFNIDAVSGLITTKSTLDYETKILYKYNVTATDKGAIPHTATTTVTVNIRDVNDNKPVFNGLPYSAKVNEDVSIRTLVKNVSAKDNDSGRNGKITFSIVSGNVGNAFVINSISGNIFSNSNLDRETRSLYYLVIRASDRGSPSLTSETTVVITIGDVNDNSPVFQGTPYRASVSENLPVGRLILKVSATDEDSGKFGQISYSIKSPSTAKSIFQIDSSAGNIVLRVPLDYEKKTTYTFVIAAIDGGRKESTTNVIVSIEDFNDNAPVFNPSTYTASVPEDVGVGHKLGFVKATDKDSGPRGRIMYSITNGNVASAFRCSADGYVTVASLLDRETLEFYNLTIKASDDGIPSQFSTTEMVVTVTDVNDNNPIFNQFSYSFSVTENNPIDHEVGGIGPATDKDKDVNAEIVYFITSGDTKREFNVDNSSGKLIAKQRLDREITSSYNLVVEARDKGTPFRYTRVPVEVIVEDVNDNTPKFSKNVYNCQISENSAENTPVCFIRASDKDEGQNGVVTYELIAPSTDFSVNQKNGEIKAIVTLDREQIASYRIAVRANDNGTPELSSNATVIVRVIDKNDNEPVFKNSKYSFNVSEDAVVKTNIGQVVAKDKDEGSNGQVVYSIIGGNINTAFEINVNTGDIQVKSLLDREKLANYKLNVRANDRGTPSLFSNKVVLINVTDVNDNSPVFTKSLYNGIIAEDASIGSVVVQVEANDPDEGNNGKITYRITGGQNKKHFSIEGDTGLIRTASILDYETKSSYLLVVTANDGGNPSRSTTSRVNITVTNTNDNVPTFVSGSSTVSVSEGVAIGTNVIKFNATDQDGSPLDFSISSGNTNSALKIDRKTALLTTNKKLDREIIPRYNLTVTVKDEGNKSSSRNLSVIVLDVNDNAPEFRPSSYETSVKENTPAGFVLRVTATDKDEGQNAKISFSIDGTSSKKFAINSATGVISSKTTFDYEQEARYVIQVSAKDAGAPSLSSVAIVVVNIIDTNDNSPNFKNDYRTTLLENTAKGRTVLRVEATDPDSGEYGEILYNITSGDNAGFFSLGKDGVLKVETSPDRETVPSFTLTIVASNKVPLDGSTTPTKSSCTVTITIEDVNDNAPIITNNVSSVNVQENSKSSTPIFYVKAVDKDIGVNGEIQYEIASRKVKSVFTIDSINGGVSVNGLLLDRETLDFYTLKIRASDKGTPTLFSDKDFTVNVTDEDDNLPVFFGVPYDASVNENSSLSTSVFQVKATDKDIGVNGKIAYSILSGNNAGHFSINKVNGRISTKVLLDYEAVQNYDLVVTAKDTKHTVQENLRIRVVNINDNSPVFNPARYNVSIAEDSKLYYHFLTLNATDKDPFGSLTYTIVSGNNNNMFTLDSSNGQLRVAAQLDRETTDFYNLKVRVTDGGKPALSDVGFVQVHITDSNDNAPTFNSSSQTTAVKENTEVGVTVLRVEATDRDLGVNAKLEYNIVNGNDKNKFGLNRDTGDLRVNGNIDRETTSHFYLDIVAKDQGSPSLISGNLRVEITVVDENDNNPEFEKKNYHQNITENLLAGSFVEQVKASDKDLELNGKVVYSIKSGGRGHFTIGNETGIIETIVPLDRENISSYSIVIEARDLGSPNVRQSTVNLFVNVLDTNDNAPRFLLHSLQGNATEEGPKEQFVTRIFAVDSDEGRNAEIGYKLATQRGEQILTIDTQTGVIRTRVAFDYEEQKVHTFKVTAFDKGNPSLSTTANLTINVIDIDDNCPEFNPKEYNVTIRENLPSNYTIVRVTATDKDSGDNKGLDYGIRSGNEAGTLAIHPVFGTIRSSNSDVDREYSDEYNLVVRAGSDYCGVNASDTDVDETTEEKLSNSICKVNIFVTDVNDNPPIFLKPSYSHVFSDIYQTSLLWLNATDPDVGVNAEVYFALAGVERVDSQRTLTVKAVDKGQPPQTSNTTLVVTMAEGVICEAMFFDVSLHGHVTVKTLCIIDKLEKVGDALVGEAIKLDCGAKGNTNAEYRWTKNSVPVSDWSKTGAFEIRSLTKDDAGQYFCIASSDAGTILSDPIELLVKESPTIIVHPVDTWAGIGERAALHCLATGDQPMEYTWYKNNKILYSTGDLITNKADLVFQKVIPEDAEEYYCEAKNSVKNEPARSKKALFQVYSADSVIEMVVSVDKPRHKKSCQYFNIQDLENVLEAVVEGTVEVTKLSKPETTCNVTHCSSDPCKNQGKCLIKETGFVCQCPRGWEGKFCEQDVDECNTESCGNGTCQNRRGSYSCDCKSGSNGKRCQLNDNVCKNRCSANQRCYPKETPKGYECINNVKTVSMVIKLDDSRMPWKNWMKYDIEREIENAIVNKWQTEGNQRSEGKRRRSIETPDYSACSVIISKTTPIGETKVQLESVLVCSTAPSKTFVCQAMFDEGKVSSCIGDGGTITEIPPTQPQITEPVRLTVLFFVRAPDEEEMETTEAVRIITESDIDTKLKPHGIKLLTLRALKQTTANRENSDKLSSGAIAGVVVTVIVVSLVLIAIAILVLRTRKRKGNEFGIEGRSVLSRTTSSQAKLTQNVSMRELKNSEARGMNNRTFSEIYEESEDNPKELEDVSFMFDNPQISTKKPDREYMDELHSSPWYHGSVSRSKTEELLDDSDNEGSFIVRAGLDEGEFYISVRAPEGGPKFHHIAVNRREGKFVAVCGPCGDTVELPTFHAFIQYLRSTPTRSDGVGPDILLKDYVEKK